MNACVDHAAAVEAEAVLVVLDALPVPQLVQARVARVCPLGPGWATRVTLALCTQDREISLPTRAFEQAHCAERILNSRQAGLVDGGMGGSVRLNTTCGEENTTNG